MVASLPTNQSRDVTANIPILTKSTNGRHSFVIGEIHATEYNSDMKGVFNQYILRIFLFTLEMKPVQNIITDIAIQVCPRKLRIIFPLVE